MITLLTTSISRSGKPLRAPMPRFHMIRSDAEAVVTYLKSLNASQWGCRTDEYYWHKFGYWRDFRDLSSFDSSCPRVEIRRERAVEARIYKNQNS
jgi:hypothetical protein